jgi:hypothetical protein
MKLPIQGWGWLILVLQARMQQIESFQRKRSVIKPANHQPFITFLRATTVMVHAAHNLFSILLMPLSYSLVGKALSLGFGTHEGLQR